MKSARGLPSGLVLLMEWESSSTLLPFPFPLENESQHSELVGLRRVPSSFLHGLCFTLLCVREALSDSVQLDHNYTINVV